MKPLVRLEKPCPVSWTSMSPAEGGRHCASCDKVVRDVSALTKNEAEELIRGNDGSLCINGLFDRARGEFIFAPEKKRLPVVSPLAVAAAMALAACGTTRTGGAPPPAPSTEQTQPNTRPEGSAPGPTPAPGPVTTTEAEDPHERLGGEAPVIEETPPPRRTGGRPAQPPPPPQPPRPELERTGGVPPMPSNNDE